MQFLREIFMGVEIGLHFNIVYYSEFMNQILFRLLDSISIPLSCYCLTNTQHFQIFATFGFAEVFISIFATRSL